jgi:hypothetical protein
MRATIARLSFPLFALGAAGAYGADVDVRVILSGEVQPGVYGRVEIGNAPPPPVLYAKPVVIVRPPRPEPVLVPVYLHVPPGHAKNWKKHCHKYGACGKPVYFVKSKEYERGYKPKKEKKDKKD